MEIILLLLRLPVGRGRVINSPFLFLFRCQKRAYCSWVISLTCNHTVKSLNSFSRTRRISQQNAHFNMYTETSKQQKGPACINFHPDCFKTTNVRRFHRAKKRTKRGRADKVLNYAMFSLCSHLNFLLRPLIFYWKYLYKTNYIGNKKATKRFLMQILDPKCYKTKNLDWFHRESIGARSFNKVLFYECYWLACFHCTTLYHNLVPH